MSNNLTQTHGDYKQVAVYDAGVSNGTGAGTSTGLNAFTSGVTVQPQGPKLEYVTVTFTGTGTTPTQMNAAIQTIQQMSTVYIYEFTTVGGGNDTLAVAWYPIGAWGEDPTTDGVGLDLALTTACGEAVVITSTATFTN